MYKRQIWKQPYESQRGTRDSEIYSACYSDLQLASDFYTQLDQLFAQIAVSAGAIVYIYGTNVVIGLSLTALGCVLILYRVLVSPRLGKYQREIQDYNALLNDVLIQRYQSREYSSFFRFSCLKNKWKDLYRAYLDSNLEQCKWQVITSVFEYGIGFLQTYLPLFLVGVLFHEFTIGMMLALITNITAFMSIFRALGRGIGELKKCRAGFERIESYFGEEAEESPKEKIDVDKLEWKVTQLSYAYGKKVGLYLQNLAYFGEKNLFLIGEKGAGKSTFTKIMLGLYRDYHGSFLCNGVELKEISEESLINGYAYLPQDFPILDLTIRENFQLAAPGKEDRFYEDYLKKANLFETVMALPEGMDTKVNAKTISTGQRQRLALCCLLYTSPSPRD